MNKSILLLIFLACALLTSAQSSVLEDIEKAKKQLDQVDPSILSTPFLLNKGFHTKSQLRPYESIQKGTSNIVHMKPSSWKQTWNAIQKSDRAQKGRHINADSSLDGYQDRKSTVPIGILHVKGDVIHNLGAKKQSIDQLNIFAASVLRQKVLSSDVTFNLVPELLLLQNGKIEDLEIDVSDGQGFRPLTWAFTTTYTSIGEKAIAIRWNSPDGPIVSYSVIDILYLEQPVPDLVIEEMSSHYARAAMSSTISDIDGMTSEVYLGCDGVFDRPVILLQGYDPFDGNTIQEHTRPKFLEAGVEGIFRDNGYDLVYLDHVNSTRDIRENAAFFMDMLTAINEAKEGDHPNILIGVSLGGLVIRYALNEIESAGAPSDVIHITNPVVRTKNALATDRIYSNTQIEEGVTVTMEAGNKIQLSKGFRVTKNSNFRATWKEVSEHPTVGGHNASHFITFDTGHKGNNVPPGAQTLVNTLQDRWVTDALSELVLKDGLDQISALLDRPASRQLLLRYEGTDPDPMHVEFQNELADIFPSNGVRNISIISGAGDRTPQPVVPTQRIVEFQIKEEILWPIGKDISLLDLRVYSNDLNTSSKISSVQIGLNKSTVEPVFDAFNYDIVSGGYQGLGNISPHMDESLTLPLVLNPLWYINPGLPTAMEIDLELDLNVSFTPVWSTIGFTGAQEEQEDLSVDVQEAVDNHLTPLDAVYANNENSVHADPRAVDDEWHDLLLNELGLTNDLDCGDPPYPYIQVEENNLCEMECAFLSLSSASNLDWTGTHTWTITGPVSDFGSGLTHVFCPEQPGVYTATVTRSNTVDGVTTSASSSMTVTFYDTDHPSYGCPDDIYLRQTSDEDELKATNTRLVAWPNPAERTLCYAFPEPSEETYSLRVMTVDGKVILRKQGQTSGNGDQLNVTQLPAGLYVIEYLSGDMRTQSKFIKN